MIGFDANGRSESPRGFVFDVGSCTGCVACELACSTENELGWGHSWRQVLTYNEARDPRLPTFHLSLACNHCADAPCEYHCPAIAIARDPGTGTIQIDPARCIGCRYCSWACPYDAPRFDVDAGVMTKCTGCASRLVDDRVPACVEACPTTALELGELAGTRRATGFPEAPAEPAIAFRGEEGRSEPVESTWELPEETRRSFADARPTRASTLSLRSEWPLLAFTLIMALLAGWALAAAVNGSVPRPLVFLHLASVALAVSTAHLGRPTRALGALRNLRRSWLSREVGLVGLFVGVTGMASLIGWVPGFDLGGASASVARFGAVLGLGAVFAIDRVYDVVRPFTTARSAWGLHSADTLLTALGCASLLGGWLPLWVLIVSLKTGLTVCQLVGGWKTDRRSSLAIMTGVRILVGLVAPTLLLSLPESSESVWAAGADWPGSGARFDARAWAIACFAIGEAVDRAAFYASLRRTTPGTVLADAERRPR